MLLHEAVDPEGAKRGHFFDLWELLTLLGSFIVIHDGLSTLAWAWEGCDVIKVIS